MSTEKIKADMIRWVEALKARNIKLLDELADELYTADYILHDPSMPDFGRGPQGVKQFTRHILQDNADVDMAIEDMFGEGDRLATRMTIRMVETSTGRRISFPVLVISHMVTGKFAEEWELVGPETEEPS